MHPTDRQTVRAHRSIRTWIAGIAAVLTVAVLAIACAAPDDPTTQVATDTATERTEEDAQAAPRPGAAASDTRTADAPRPGAATSDTRTADEPAVTIEPPASDTDASTADAPTPDDAIGSTPTATPPADPTPAPTTEPVAVPSVPTGIEPARLVIDAIDVDAPVIDLDLRGSEPEVPEDFDDVGWYTQTRLPGELGPAVLAGHIDSRSGPAVFHRLDRLVPGDEIVVVADDGTTRTFVVTGAGQYPKTALPDEVFGVRGDGADLRLITCGGTFDRSDGHYRDNYVVYATALDA